MGVTYQSSSLTFGRSGNTHYVSCIIFDSDLQTCFITRCQQLCLLFSLGGRVYGSHGMYDVAAIPRVSWMARIEGRCRD
jgi:hypothetical protein